MLLKYGFKIPCNDKDNIHVAHKEHLVCCGSEKNTKKKKINLLVIHMNI